MFPTDFKSSTQIEAERTSQTLNTKATEINLPSTSKQQDVKQNKELKTKAMKTTSPS